MCQEQIKGKLYWKIRSLYEIIPICLMYRKKNKKMRNVPDFGRSGGFVVVSLQFHISATAMPNFIV